MQRYSEQNEAGHEKYGEIRISCNGGASVMRKNKNLGSFDNFNDAVFIRQQAEKKYFGDFRFEEESNE